MWGKPDLLRCFFSCSSCLSYLSCAGHFGTKGLAIIFISLDGDQQVMAVIQARFEVAVPELPDHIDPASYSMSFCPIWC